MDPVWWRVLSITLIIVGVIGTFIPVLPGVVLIFGGMLLGAWIDGFHRVGWVTLVILGVLTAVVLAIDIAAGFFGAKRVGASRLALLGAAVGALVGIFFGIVGILIAPFVGAVIGELISSAQIGRAARVGIATWVGMAVGALAKMVVVVIMLGVFVASYFLS